MKLIKSLLYEKIHHSLRSRIEAEVEYIEINKYQGNLYNQIVLPLIRYIDDSSVFNQLKIDTVDAKSNE